MEAQWKPNKEGKEFLEDFGRNITELAKNGKLDPVVGRESEIRRVIRTLSRRRKNNPILIGEPGVGKTAIVEGMALNIVNNNVPSILKNKEIFELNIGSLISGAKYQGEFEERVQKLIDVIKKSNGEIILFIDEIHTLVGAGQNQGSLDAANMFKPILARGEIRLIGATTINEYKKHIEKDSALERRMQKVLVPEPSVTDAINILRGIKDKYEAFHGVRIHDNALVSSAVMSERYIADRFLPDKAIDLIDEAASLIKTNIESMPEHLENQITSLSELKIEQGALKKEKDKKSISRLKEIDEEIKKIEPQVLEKKKKWEENKNILKKYKEKQEFLDYERSRLAISQQEGKFELAGKIQYEIIPKIEKELTIFKEIMDKNPDLHDEINENTIALIVSRWTGIPVESLVESEKQKLLNLEKNIKKEIKGQDEAISIVSNSIKRSRVGLNDENRPIGSFLFLGTTGVGKTELIRSIARNIFNSEKEMIRLDMSEYKEIHSVAKLIGSPPGYVGYEEGGRLTEAVRRRPYSIILLDEIEKAHPEVFDLFLQILDSGTLTDSQGRSVNFKNTIIVMTSNIGADKFIENEEFDVNEILMKYFRVEFINRIDEIIKFKTLEKKHLKEISRLELNKLKTRLENQNYFIEFDDSVIENIVKNSYDPLYGARPIKRYISKEIENFITDLIIDSKVKKDEKTTISSKEEKLVLSKNLEH